ncbi:MAG: hypothetical protein AAF004_15110 [Pseudomonadota bacterium]
MSDNQNMLSAVGAISLAVIYSLYWMFEIGFSQQGTSLEVLANGLSPMDFVFLMVGALNVFFYISVRRVLYEHYHYAKLNVVFASLIGVCVVFYIGTFAADAAASLIGSDLASTVIALITLFAIIAFGILDILVGVMLLRDADTRSDLLRVFAIASLIMGIMEITILLSIVALVVFPFTVALMAVYFLREPEAVEFV